MMAVQPSLKPTTTSLLTITIALSYLPSSLRQSEKNIDNEEINLEGGWGGEEEAVRQVDRQRDGGGRRSSQPLFVYLSQFQN